MFFVSFLLNAVLDHGLEHRLGQLIHGVRVDPLIDIHAVWHGSATRSALPMRSTTCTIKSGANPSEARCCCGGGDITIIWDVDEGRAYVPGGCVRRCVVDAYSSQGVMRRRKGRIYRRRGKGRIYDATSIARKTVGKQGNLFGIESWC